jgi:protocatechuate 3,4-dioxygenase beta subunit
MTLILSILLAFALAPTSSPQGTGQLSGRVTTDSGAPLAGVRVVLAPGGRPMLGPVARPPQATTGDDGRFAFENVPPGEYRIDIQKAGYAPPYDMTTRPQTYTIVSGQALRDIDFQLQRGAVISGRVLDSRGEPIADVRVMAFRRGPEGRGGQRPLLQTPGQGLQQTNDIGEFRIAGLLPGEYFVAAAPQRLPPFGASPAGPAAGSAARTAITTTFYPGSTDQSGAQPITVTAGAEISSIVFTIATAPVFRVSGIVVDEEGKPVARAMVNLMGDSPTRMFGSPGSAMAQDDGQFVIGEVPSGTYRIMASVPIAVRSGTTWQSSEGSAGGVTMTTTSGGGSYATVDGQPGSVTSIQVVVADADVTGVRVVVRRPPPR